MLIAQSKLRGCGALLRVDSAAKHSGEAAELLDDVGSSLLLAKPLECSLARPPAKPLGKRNLYGIDDSLRRSTVALEHELECPCGAQPEGRGSPAISPGRKGNRSRP